jgi:hypothetical protein
MLAIHKPVRARDRWISHLLLRVDSSTVGLSSTFSYRILNDM